MAAEGVTNDRIATDLRVSATSVRSWRRRFSGEGLARFAQVRAGRGPKPSISAETVEAIVQATLRSKPKGRTHWSCRTMGKQFGSVRRRCNGSGMRGV